jgi:hypothetical protein
VILALVRLLLGVERRRLERRIDRRFDPVLSRRIDRVVVALEALA